MKMSFTGNESNFAVTVSCGVAEFNKDYESINKLITVADRALYKAKNGGRNKTILAKGKK